MSEEALTTAETADFNLHERVAIEGRTTFFLVGHSLGVIKERGWFKTKGFESWEDYCESIGYSKRHANQLILDHKTVAELPENLRKLVTDEKAARALAKLPAPVRREVAESASGGGRRKITTNEVKRNAPPPPPRPSGKKNPPQPPQRRGAPAPKPETKPERGPEDYTGVEIPREARELWGRAGEANKLLSFVSSLKGALRIAQENRDPLFAEVDFVDSLAKLDQVYVDLKRAVPYAVCPDCNGKSPTPHCTCKGRGMVSEFFWKTCVPQEVKKVTGRDK